MNWKKVIIVASILVFMSVLTVWAGEKEELQLRAELLIAKANLAQCQTNFAQCQQRESQKLLPDSQKAIQDFVKELDIKGYMVNQEGNVVEKPKAQTPPSPSSNPSIVPKEKK